MRKVKLTILVGIVAGALLASGALLTGLKNNLLAAAGQETDGAVIAEALIWAGVDSGRELKLQEGEFEEMVARHGGEVLGKKEMIVRDEVYYYNYVQPEVLEKMGVKIEESLMKEAAKAGKVPVVVTKELEAQGTLGEEFLVVGRTAPQKGQLPKAMKEVGILRRVLDMVSFSGKATMMIVGEGEAAEKFFAESELVEKYETPILKFQNAQKALEFIKQEKLPYDWTDWEDEEPIIVEELFTNQIDIAFAMGLLEAGWFGVSWIGMAVITVIVLIELVRSARQEKRGIEARVEIWKRYTRELMKVMLGALAIAVVVSVVAGAVMTAMKGEILATNLGEYYGWSVPVRMMWGWSWGMTVTVAMLLGLMPVCAVVGKEAR